MNRIERYLASVVISHTALVMVVLLVIFGFFEFMNQVAKLTDSYTLSQGALYTLLKFPVYSYELFPIVLLIGTLMGLGSLANQSELTVLRVTGWSIKRILWAVLKAAFIMWLVVAMIGEWVAPASEAYAKKMRAEALHQGFSIGSSNGLWVKESGRYIHVERVISSTSLKNITFYQVGGSALTQLSQVDSAQFKDGHWQFKNAIQQTLGFTPNTLENAKMASGGASSNDAEQAIPAHLNLSVERLDRLESSFPLTPAELNNLDIETRYLSVVDLYHYIQFLEQNGLESGAHELEFWRKVSMPLMVVALISIVFPLIFGSIRQVSMGQRIFIGVLIGMGFYLLNQMIGNLTVVYHLPVLLGAFLPSLLLLSGALFWLKRVR
ncbi:MAG: LPS export ABC transporter permease LptG [Gammaproteobacteria bacterium]|nr:LPS export ABC transporter permease LptG [Gammaproteobacteria bacterium]